MKNNKGFMLAEVVVTSTVILTSLISLYITFNKLYKNYEIRSRYYDIDGYYVTKEIIELLINNNINNYLPLTTENYKELSIDNQDLKNEINSIISAYQIQQIYVTKYTSTSLDNLKNSSINNTFKDYLEKYYNYNDNKYSYLFIIEYKNENDYYYANIGLG